MADIFNKYERSKIMSRIRSKRNKSTELKLIKIFREENITGWKRNYKVKGHPDFVFLKRKIAFFVDGCFWHGHKCQKHIPYDNNAFWSKKIQYNKSHDNIVNKLFQSRGWTVVRIWECELKRKNRQMLERKIRVLMF